MAKKTTISFSLENRKKTDDDVRISRIVGDSVYGYRQLNILPHKYRCELLPEKRNFSVDLTSDGVYEFAIYRYSAICLMPFFGGRRFFHSAKARSAFSRVLQKYIFSNPSFNKRR